MPPAQDREKHVVFQNPRLAVFHIKGLCKILRLEMARIHHGGDDGDDEEDGDDDWDDGGDEGYEGGDDDEGDEVDDDDDDDDDSDNDG